MDFGLIEKWHELIHPIDDKKLVGWLKKQKVLCLGYSEVSDNLRYFIDEMNNLIGSFYLFNPFGYPTREFCYYKPRLAIFRTFYHEGLFIVYDKTYLLSRIQKKWKKYYTNLQKRKRIAKKPKSIIYREIYGRFPKN